MAVLTKLLTAGNSLTLTESMAVTKITILGTNAENVTVTGKSFENPNAAGDSIILNSEIPALTIEGNPVTVLSGLEIASPTTGTATIVGIN